MSCVNSTGCGGRDRGYPMWHLRFTKARNLLGEACAEMEQAVFEDGHNAVFQKLLDRMDRLCKTVTDQQMRNYRRGKKEGWLK